MLLSGKIFTILTNYRQDGIYLGGETGYDLNKGAVTKYAASLGYFTRDYAAALHSTNNFSTFSGTYYHRVNVDVEAAMKATWDSKANNNKVDIEIATKYYLDSDAFVKAKVANTGILSLAYTQLLRPGVKATIGGTFDTTKLDQNAHKVGINLVMEN